MLDLLDCNGKKDIKSMTLEEVTAQMAALGEKSFRAKQLYDWMHVKLAEGFDDMSSLSIPLRQKLKENYSLTCLKMVDERVSQVDGTRKYLFGLEDGHVTALWTQPQIIGQADKNGRPSPNGADQPELRVPADIIIVAIGQGIETHGFEQSGIKIQRGGTILADSGTHLPDMEGVFAGGDCVTGPATVIRAIAAGKVAAANIDEYLGYCHTIEAEVEIPAPHLSDFTPRGRVSTTEREAGARKMDFQCIECGMTLEEAQRESARCLRCDHFGYGVFKGGREEKW